MLTISPNQGSSPLRRRFESLRTAFGRATAAINEESSTENNHGFTRRAVLRTASAVGALTAMGVPIPTISVGTPVVVTRAAASIAPAVNLLWGLVNTN